MGNLGNLGKMGNLGNLGKIGNLGNLGKIGNLGNLGNLGSLGYLCLETVHRCTPGRHPQSRAACCHGGHSALIWRDPLGGYVHSQ